MTPKLFRFQDLGLIEKTPKSTYGIEPLFDSSPRFEEEPYLFFEDFPAIFPAIGGWGCEGRAAAGVAPRGCCDRWWPNFAGDLPASGARTQTKREREREREMGLSEEGESPSPLPSFIGPRPPPSLPRWARGRYALRNPPAPFLIC
jgi:hypothetical protein